MKKSDTKKERLLLLKNTLNEYKGNSSPLIPKDYNDKAFLLPESPDSCAMYHAKVVPEEQRWKLTIHDCHTGIRLLGKLQSDEDYVQAVEKLSALINGIDKLRCHLVNERFNQIENK